MGSCANLDVITRFCDDKTWNVRVNPVVSSLVEHVFEVKVEGEHPGKEVSKIAVHWVVANCDAAVANASDGIVVVGHCGDGVCRIEKAQTEL